MGKVELFTIYLEKQQAIYMAGETVRGQLVIKINERLKINSVKMLLNGKARVHWSESHGSGKNRHTVHYSSYEQYLNFNMIFLAKQGSNDLYMEVGDYSYPFQIILPPTLPTSFEHSHGRIRYSLNGQIDIPWAFDKHVERSITVISPLDLNLNPSLRQQATVQDTKTLCCWCCKSGPIIATLSIFKGGYVPGEVIVFNAVIDNKSSSEIKNVTFKIVQNITLRATTKSRTFSRMVTEITYPKRISANAYEEWKDSVLKIPPISASSNQTCRIIDVYYFVVLNVNPEGMSFSFELSIPVVIGTIPIMSIGANSSFSHIYEPSPFETANIQELDDRKEGEVFNMDTNFSPYYPYYKDFSIMPH